MTRVGPLQRQGNFAGFVVKAGPGAHDWTAKVIGRVCAPDDLNAIAELQAVMARVREGTEHPLLIDSATAGREYGGPQQAGRDNSLHPAHGAPRCGVGQGAQPSRPPTRGNRDNEPGASA